MKVTDYIVHYMEEKGVHDVFGYSGGVICHLIDSITKSGKLRMHACYHEQAAAFSACALGQAENRPGVAFATSGPGATNLVTGIANAYYDSIPTVFFTGQVDTYSLKGNQKISQMGFQETDIISIVSPITKYAVQILNEKDICYEVEKAWWIACSGRKGPVLIDLPADIQRAEIDPDTVLHYQPSELKCEMVSEIAAQIMKELQQSKRPCILVGCAVKQNKLLDILREIVHILGIPVVSSMNAMDVLPADDPLYMGFIGTNGHRCANMVVEKADLLLSLGSRMDLKQVGNRKDFAPSAKILRVDLDAGELSYFVHSDEKGIQVDLNELLPAIRMQAEPLDTNRWLAVCAQLKQALLDEDCKDLGHQYLMALAPLCSAKTAFALDVGQNEVWAAQALRLKENQRVFLSGGLGTMGYSLPAAVGLCYAGFDTVVSINGDGGLQMNLQELQTLLRDSLPIKVIVLNNRSLGMIRQFQEANFNANYALTTAETGYSPVDFEAIAKAYKLPFARCKTVRDLEDIASLFSQQGATLIECCLPETTWLYPKFGRAPDLVDQEPKIDRIVYSRLKGL